MRHDEDRSAKVSDRFNIRIDERLRSRIKAAAQASRRTMNAEICHRIEQAFIQQRPEETLA